MQATHGIHTYIALHKTRNRGYSAAIGSKMVRPGKQGAARRQGYGTARRSNAGHDAERPDRRKRHRTWNSERRTPPPSVPPMRLATLLLPVANHLYDARRTSSPGGRYLFGPDAEPLPPSRKTPLRQKPAHRPTWRRNMRRAHGCHSVPALLLFRQAIYVLRIGRATSPPPNVPDKDWQPLLLPSCQSISATPAGFPPPAGVRFSEPSQPSMHNWP